MTCGFGNNASVAEGQFRVGEVTSRDFVFRGALEKRRDSQLTRVTHADVPQLGGGEATRSVSNQASVGKEGLTGRCTGRVEGDGIDRRGLGSALQDDGATLLVDHLTAPLLECDAATVRSGCAYTKEVRTFLLDEENAREPDIMVKVMSKVNE